MAMPLVSVVITTYNRAELVEDAIDSVLAQTYTNFELFVVDDASTDNTESVIDQYDDDRLTYVCHESNKHLSASRNTGIELSSGEYIAFLDDDDEWIETKLERQISRFEDVSDQVGLVYCWMDYYDNGKVIKENRPNLNGNIHPRTLSGQPLTNGSTWLIKAEVFNTVGRFDETIYRGVDGDFLRRVCKECNVNYVPEVLVIYNVGHGSRRITAEDKDGFQAAIEGEQKKLQKYKSEFEKYPTQEAIVRAKIGWRRTQLGEWRGAIVEFSRAIKLGPTCSTVYFYMGVTMYHTIKSSI